MKGLRFLLGLVLCCTLAGGVAILGCGDDDDDGIDCNAFCNKVAECFGENADECKGECNAVNQECKDCAKNCNLGASCEAFGACVEGCTSCPND